MCEAIKIDFKNSTKGNIKVINGKKTIKLTKDGKLKNTPNNSKKNRDYILPFAEKDISKMIEWLDNKILCSENEQQEIINIRNKAIFLMGCNCGLRVSDLCSLRWNDVFDNNGKLRVSKIITPKKTANKGKHIEIELTDAFKIALIEYIENGKIKYSMDYIQECDKLQRKLEVQYRNLNTMEKSKSDKYSEKDIKLCQIKIKEIEKEMEYYNERLWVFPSRQGGHIKPEAIDYFLKCGAKACDINYPIATHSLRKTYARIKYDHSENKTQAAKYLQTIFGHSSEAITMIYIGIRQEEIRDFCNETPIGVDVENGKNILEKYV